MDFLQMDIYAECIQSKRQLNTQIEVLYDLGLKAITGNHLLSQCVFEYINFGDKFPWTIKNSKMLTQANKYAMYAERKGSVG